MTLSKKEEAQIRSRRRREQHETLAKYIWVEDNISKLPRLGTLYCYMGFHENDHDYYESKFRTPEHITPEDLWEMVEGAKALERHHAGSNVYSLDELRMFTFEDLLGHAMMQCLTQRYTGSMKLDVALRSDEYFLEGRSPWKGNPHAQMVFSGRRLTEVEFARGNPLGSVRIPVVTIEQQRERGIIE